MINIIILVLLVMSMIGTIIWGHITSRMEDRLDTQEKLLNEILKCREDKDGNYLPK